MKLVHQLKGFMLACLFFLLASNAFANAEYASGYSYDSEAVACYQALSKGQSSGKIGDLLHPTTLNCECSYSASGKWDCRVPLERVEKRTFGIVNGVGPNSQDACNRAFNRAGNKAFGKCRCGKAGNTGQHMCYVPASKN